MKRLLKKPFRALWRWGAPIRRPIMAKIEATLVRCCNQPRAIDSNEDMMLLMDHLVRELVRLQKQVDMLQQAVEELTVPATGLSVVGREEATASLARSVAG